MGTINGKQTRINAKHFALTFPQLYTAEQGFLWPKVIEAFEKLAVEFPVMCIVCGAERHEDGNWHLHVYLQFIKKTKINHSRLDELFGKHGNYQRVINQGSSL